LTGGDQSLFNDAEKHLKVMGKGEVVVRPSHLCHKVTITTTSLMIMMMVVVVVQPLSSWEMWAKEQR